ncbi:unnamed protein product [Scytosiphon promiscuus]
MTVTRTSRVSERRECETRYSRRYTDIDASLAEDRRRRAARKAAKLESSRKAQYEIGRRRRDAKMALLLRLLTTVLEREPWDSARHKKVVDAWGECGRQVPEYLKEGGRTEPGMLVRTNVTRMARQLSDPTSKPPWKSHPEVTQTVEKVVTKLGATRRYGERFGPHRQQEGAVEPKKTDLATVETAHATPE